MCSMRSIRDSAKILNESAYVSVFLLFRSYKGTAVVLFSAEKSSSAGEECGLVTVDVSDTGAEVRSTHFTKAVTGLS